ncbi:MAG: DNA primase, partial [Pseudomonadota bacterium]
LLWRMSSEPILCFDGDTAGQKAAYRAIDTALPLLQAGQSLRFAFLSSGLDPDDLIRQQGPDAMRDVLNRAQPLADVLWQREWNASDWSTPERRAGLEKRLRHLVSEIKDQGVRSHYGQVLRERLDAAWNINRGQATQTTDRQSSYGNRQAKQRNWKQNKRNSLGARLNASNTWIQHSASLKQSGLVAGAGQSIPDREALLIRTLLNHPWLLDEFAEDIADLEFASQTAKKLRDGLLTIHANELELDRSVIHNQLEVLRLGQDLELVNRIATHKSDRFAEQNAETSDVVAGWRHTVALHRRQMMQSELLATEREYLDTGDEDAMTRLVELQRQIAHSLANEALLED